MSLPSLSSPVVVSGLPFPPPTSLLAPQRDGRMVGCCHHTTDFETHPRNKLEIARLPVWSANKLNLARRERYRPSTPEDEGGYRGEWGGGNVGRRSELDEICGVELHRAGRG